MLSKKLIVALGTIVVLSLVLSGCVTPTPETIVETVIVTEVVETVIKTVEVMVTPEPTKEPEAGPKILVVCQEQEPSSLYFNGTSMTAAWHVFSAVYDGPIDNRTYAYQPIILEKLPSVDDGDAVLQVVTVQEGDMVVEADGNVVELTAGMYIHPAGCMVEDCIVEFDGTPIEMDQMVVIFKMIDGLLWSNGDPLTADDSVYNFELVSDPDTVTDKSTVERTTSYEAVDDSTTVWTGLPGYIDEVYFTNFFTPMPRKLWQEELGYSAADLIDAEESSRMPMGWGAFILTEWVAGDHITAVKNPNYFRASEGLPNVDKVIYRFVTDANAALAQLISGECDIVTQDGSMADQALLLLKLEQQKVLNPVFVTDTHWEHVDFGIIPAPDYDRQDFFGDIRTRQAIAHCLDRQTVIDTILYGRSIVIDNYIPPEHPLYNPDIKTYPYDPTAGEALLEDAGWVDSDGDGIRKASGVEGVPDGTLLEFSWQSTTQPMVVTYMQIFQQNLLECGIKVNLMNLPADEYFGAVDAGGPLWGRHFDMASFTSGTGVKPPCTTLYISSEIPSDENNWVGQNDSGFMNAEYDAACTKAISNLPGSQASIDGYLEAQRVFAEQLPVIPLFLYLKIAVTRPEVKGFTMDTTGKTEMWNIETLDLDTM